MSILIHKVGVNKTLGQQSDRPYPGIDEYMIGDWRPNEGIDTHYWSNQAEAGNSYALRRFNGITHNNSTPHNFQFDGTDDYLGTASSSYGGSPFVMDAAAAFCLAQWVKYNAVNHFAFVLDDGDETATGTESIVLDLNSSTSNKATVTVLSSIYDVSNAATTFNFTFADDTWYYIALTHDGAGNYKFYVNGSFVGSSAIGRCADSGALEIGKYGSSYTGAGTKIGHVHVDEGWGSNSDKMMPSYLIRQRFLYTHKMHSDRIYGNTFQA